MPSPPGSHPSRQLTVRLPWHVWARLVALAKADPHGARPGRVAATALDRGVEVLERAAALRGTGGRADAPTGPTAPALARRVAAKARAAGLDAKARAGVVTVTALSAPEADALTAENDRRWPGDGGAGHIPDGLPPDAVTIAPRAERGEKVSAEPGKALAAAWQARGDAVG